jgi:(1->4)-alpha-D-glucan 1-alpha-D-glucosylmutase
VTNKTLTFRRNHPEVFLFGEYIPLQVTGTSPVTCAYLRRYENQAVMIIIPLALAAVNERSDEFVILPPELAGTWINVFTRTETVVTDQISVTRLLTGFPVALLANFQLK